MFSYLQMPFLQALGYAIANSIWQVFLLWLIVLLVNSLSRQSSQIRYITALSAQVAGFVWFLTTFQFYYRHCLAASVQAEQLANGNAAMYLRNVVTGRDGMLSFLVRTEETLPYLSLTYLLFLGYLVIKWVQSYRFTRVLSATGLEAIDTHWQLFVNDMADRLNIMQDVKIYLSSVAKSPLTIGYVKPIILIPIASINHLTAEQLEAVILHEMAHIKRADYIINLMVSVAEMVMFFNPFTRLLGNAIQKERENCCDDWVLQYRYDAGMYAEALLRIACLQKEGFEMNAAATQKGALLQRVKRMIQPSQKKFSYRHQATAMMFIAVLLFCIAWLQPGENDYHKTTTAGNRTEDKNIMIAPMMAQVDNPFFNGASLLSPSLHDDVLQSLSEWDEAAADSAATGIEEAQKALAKAAPIAIATMSSGNWQRMVKEAIAKADLARHNVSIQLSDNAAPQQLFDSAFLLQTVQAALSNTDRLKDLQINTDTDGKELDNLKDKAFNYNFSFSTDYLNGLCTNALASLQNLHVSLAQDSFLAVSDKLKTMRTELNKKTREREEKQAQMIEQLEECRNKILTSANNRRRMLPPTPTGIQVVPAEPEDATVPDVTDSQDNNNDYDDLPDNVQPAVSGWAFSEPAAYHNADSRKKARTIHITQRNETGSYNIIIEINKQ